MYDCLCFFFYIFRLNAFLLASLLMGSDQIGARSSVLDGVCELWCVAVVVVVWRFVVVDVRWRVAIKVMLLTLDVLMDLGACCPDLSAFLQSQGAPQELCVPRV